MKIPRYNWGQLGPILGVEIVEDDNQESKEFEQALVVLWHNIVCDRATKRDKQKIHIIRMFLRKLYRNDIGYCGPAFLGIASIEDDETFLQWFGKIYDWCWN